MIKENVESLFREIDARIKSELGEYKCELRKKQKNDCYRYFYSFIKSENLKEHFLWIVLQQRNLQLRINFISFDELNEYEKEFCEDCAKQFELRNTKSPPPGHLIRICITKKDDEFSVSIEGRQKPVSITSIIDVICKAYCKGYKEKKGKYPETIHMNENPVIISKKTQEDINTELNRLFPNFSPVETEEYRIQKRRLYQDKFRNMQLELWNSKCAVTGISCTDILEASHIKPWNGSSDDERLYKYNGFLLTANLHKLFDNGLISFNNDGKILFSKELNVEDRKKLMLNEHNQLSKVYEESIQFLELHRAKVFKK
jgi:hypothetical protein